MVINENLAGARCFIFDEKESEEEVVLQGSHSTKAELWELKIVKGARMILDSRAIEIKEPLMNNSEIVFDTPEDVYYNGKIERCRKLTKQNVGLLVLGCSAGTGELVEVKEGVLQSGNQMEVNYRMHQCDYSVHRGAKLIFSRNQQNVSFSTQSIFGEGDVEFSGQKDGYFSFRGLLDGIHPMMINWVDKQAIYTGKLSYTGQTIVKLELGSAPFNGSLWLELDDVLPPESTLNMVSGKVYMRNQSKKGIRVSGIIGENSKTFITSDDRTIQKLTVDVPIQKKCTYSGVIGWDHQSFTTESKGNNISLTKAGLGVQVLSGANTYKGETSILDGLLIVSGAAISGSTSEKIESAVFSRNSILISFNSEPLAGETYRLLPGATAKEYGNIKLIGAGVSGKKARYSSSDSTLLIESS